MATGLTRARNREEHRARVRARASLREAAAAKRDPEKTKALWALRGEAAERFDQAKHPRGDGGKWAQGAGGDAPVVVDPALADLPPPLLSPKPHLYAAAFQRNRDFTRPGPYHTELKPEEEKAFHGWLEKNQVPYNPRTQISDYDLRGYWKANPKAKLPEELPHTFKTPYDPAFSKESQYATPDCPFAWHENQLVDERSGQVIFR